MPHLIIEYGQELANEQQIQPMIDAVHDAVLSSGLFTENDIMTRMVPLVHYRNGSGQHPSIHAQLRIMAGRSAVQKKDLSDAVLNAIRTQGWSAMVITVEVAEMDKDSYCKYSELN